MCALKKMTIIYYQVLNCFTDVCDVFLKRSILFLFNYVTDRLLVYMMCLKQDVCKWDTNLILFILLKYKHNSHGSSKDRYFHLEWLITCSFIPLYFTTVALIHSSTYARLLQIFHVIWSKMKKIDKFSARI